MPQERVSGEEAVQTRQIMHNSGGSTLQLGRTCAHQEGEMPHDSPASLGEEASTLFLPVQEHSGQREQQPLHDACMMQVGLWYLPVPGTNWEDIGIVLENCSDEDIVDILVTHHGFREWEAFEMIYSGQVEALLFQYQGPETDDKSARTPALMDESDLLQRERVHVATTMAPQKCELVATVCSGSSAKSVGNDLVQQQREQFAVAMSGGSFAADTHNSLAQQKYEQFGATVSGGCSARGENDLVQQKCEQTTARAGSSANTGENDLDQRTCGQFAVELEAELVKGLTRSLSQLPHAHGKCAFFFIGEEDVSTLVPSGKGYGGRSAACQTVTVASTVRQENQMSQPRRQSRGQFESNFVQRGGGMPPNSSISVLNEVATTNGAPVLRESEHFVDLGADEQASKHKIFQGQRRRRRGRPPRQHPRGRDEVREQVGKTLV